MRFFTLWIFATLVFFPELGRAIIDLDGDGLSDVWEARYGTTLPPGGDNDGDGLKNAVEAYEGTNPFDPASKHPAATPQALGGSLYRFVWSSILGKYYQLEASFDAGANWVSIGPAVQGTGATIDRRIDATLTYLGTGPQLTRYEKLADSPPLAALKAAIANKAKPTLNIPIPTVEVAQTSPNVDHAGTCVSGWLLPPADGYYSFWVAGDDVVEFSLSSNWTSQALKPIALSKAPTKFRDWTARAEQQSAPVALKGGTLYYFQLNQQEVSGLDFASLAWTGPTLNVDKEIVSAPYVTNTTETLYRRMARAPQTLWRFTVHDRDSDGDGLTDAEELSVGLNPFDAKTFSRTDDLETLTSKFSSRNVITVGAEVARAYESGAQPARFTFLRTGNINAVTVRFSVTGTARAGTDYTPLAGQVSFGVGQNSASVELQPAQDGLFEPAESVTATLLSSAAYDLGAIRSATVTIDDAADIVYVASLRGDATRGGYGTAALTMAGNQAFAELAVTFGNLTSAVTSGAIVWLPGAGRIVPLKTMTPAEFPSFRWDMAATAGLTHAQIVALLAQGQLAFRLYSEKFAGGELMGPLLRTWGWQASSVPAAPGPAQTVAGNNGDAAHFLSQATFGATPEEMASVKATSFAAWLTAQFAKPATLHLPYVRTRQAQLMARSGNDGYQSPRQEAWWQAALTAPDQLRQRMAFALSEIFVIADSSPLENDHEGVTNYYDLLVSRAFGNFRDLLNDITLNPMMGQYLSMARNQKPNPLLGSEPDENYARELMQLFTLGLNRLNKDGSLMLDARGLPIPTYTQNDIVGLAHVLTGWGPWYDPAKPPADIVGYYRYSSIDPLKPLVLYPAFHDLKGKTIVNNTVVPAGLDGAADLKFALDTIFQHPNVPPFIARQLIQRFVTSNPSPGYIYRVASKFENNGAGMRGDLKAVITAVLLDPEARNPVFTTSPTHGKLREPLLRVSELLRAFHAAPPLPPDNRYFLDLQSQMPYQSALKAPSVFNFFSPNYLPPGRLAAAGLYAPEFQITQENTVVSESNLVHNLVHVGFGTRERTATGGVATINVNLSPYTNLLLRTAYTQSVNQAAVLTSLNDLLLGGRISPGLRQAVNDAWDAVPATFGFTLTDQLERVRLAIYIIATSPEYAVLN